MENTNSTNAFTFSCSIPADVLNHRLDVVSALVTKVFDTFAPLLLKAITDEQERSAAYRVEASRNAAHMDTMHAQEAERGRLALEQQRLEVEQLRAELANTKMRKVA